MLTVVQFVVHVTVQLVGYLVRLTVIADRLQSLILAFPQLYLVYFDNELLDCS